MLRTRALPFSFVLFLLLLSTAAPAAADSTVRARLEAQNASGVGGTATLTATSGGDLVVHIKATGLMPGPHAQHIHGFEDGGHAMCASMMNDKNGDGVITNEEGTGEYGTIFLALTTRGDTSAESGLALDRMPQADADGNLEYHRTISAADVPADLLDNMSALHVVQHGIDVNDNGRYDLKALGESTFAKSLGLPDVPEEATNPASCGVVTGASASTSPHGGIETGGADGDSGLNAPMVLAGLALLTTAVVTGWFRYVRTSSSRG
ncbi:MAG TPA: hypothetical protein VES21_09305 [Nocardioidaceae bacterium]|nr:hypothetical protein [Nocardioidaceae bacterium]